MVKNILYKKFSCINFTGQKIQHFLHPDDEISEIISISKFLSIKILLTMTYYS